jgi:hypothetical protein
MQNEYRHYFDQILRYIEEHSSVVVGMFRLQNRARKSVILAEFYLGFSPGKFRDSNLN